MKLTPAESRSLTEVLKENTHLAAELAESKRYEEQNHQRIRELEAALREVQTQWWCGCTPVMERIRALLGSVTETADAIASLGEWGTQQSETDDRHCTCHPHNRPPGPRQRKYALTECIEAYYASKIEGKHG